MRRAKLAFVDGGTVFADGQRFSCPILGLAFILDGSLITVMVCVVYYVIYMDRQSHRVFSP
jgi:hypothetical protein